jgi:hypothetical protein
MMNKEGYRFYLEMQLMLFAIEAQSTLKITDTNEAHLAGELSLTWDEELGTKVANLITTAAGPAVEALRAVWEVLDNVKNQCSSCTNCGLLDFSCKISCCALFKTGLAAAKTAFDLAKQSLGAVADIAVSILDHANDIFSIHSAKFDLLLESTLSANFEVTIDATVLGSRRSSTFTINLEKLDESAQKVASGFEPLLFSP